MKTTAICLPDYIFNSDSNPYFFDQAQPKSVKSIAKDIDNVIRSNYNAENILIRGIQSGLHTSISRHRLIDAIIANGSDVYDNYSDGATIHAAPFNKDTTHRILEGFHVYKPKGEDRPQYPIDIWMIFDKNAYTNIKYIHPRHHVFVNDKWKLRKGRHGLIGLMIVN